MSDFKVEGMDKPRKLLLFRSTKSKKEFKPGGSMYGQEYRFGINEQTFEYSKLSLMRMTGMTEEEYNKWKKQYEHNK